ncbi:hypothetical protein ABRY23_10130 [Melioribacteraceae bacterium 4301-Me]|uniref:hypothetical protein n=1 Tax=Pyranulibacter aquaticus TaxID=3163344 RepID=UPI00359A6203
MIFKSISMYFMKNKTSDEIEYYCYYVTKHKRRIKARITKSTYEMLISNKSQLKKVH